MTASSWNPVAETEEPEDRPKEGHVKIIYTGSVAPHWDYRSNFGDHQVIEDFKMRAGARLLLLPRDDPQFRRNYERIVRDAERHNLLLEWDFGYEPEELDESAPDPSAPDPS